MDEGNIASMRAKGITESFKLKRQVVLSASEAAEMIMRSVYLILLQCFNAETWSGSIISCALHLEREKRCKSREIDFICLFIRRQD